MRGVGLLADEPGLGKTITILALLCLEKQAHPQHLAGPAPSKTLIVLPAELLAQWQEQLNLYAPQLKVGVLPKLGRAPHEELHASKEQVIAALAPFEVVLVASNVLTADAPKKRDASGSAWAGTTKKRPLRHHAAAVREMRWWRVVVDESHRVRNSETQIAKACARLSAPNRWLMSGTPITRSPDDLRASFAFLGLAPFSDDKVWRKLISEPLEYEDLEDAAHRVVHSLLAQTMMHHDKHRLMDSGALSPPQLLLHAIEPKQPSEVHTIHFSEAVAREVLGFDEQAPGMAKDLLSKLDRGSMFKDMKTVCSSGELANMELLNRSRAALYSMTNFRLPNDVLLQDVWELPFEHALSELAVTRGTGNTNVGADVGQHSIEDIFAQGVAQRDSVLLTDRTSAQRKDHLYEESEDQGLTTLLKIGQQRTTRGVMCTICQQQVYRPTFTRCKHCFCRGCIVKEIESQIVRNYGNDRDTVCPVCKDKVQLRNGRLIEVVRLDAQPAQPPAAARPLAQSTRLPPTQLSQDFIPAFTSEALRGLGLPRQAQQYDPVQSAMYPHVPAQAMWAYTECFNRPSTKIVEVCKLLSKIRATDPAAKCLIFSRENHVLEQLAKHLPHLYRGPGHEVNRGVEFIVLTSAQTVRVRSDAQQNFQLRADPWLCLCSPLVSGVGINLHAANHILLMEPFEVEAEETQAISRLLRMGQKKQVHVTQLFVRGSVEERILQLRREHDKTAPWSFGGTLRPVGTSRAQDKFIFGMEDIRRLANDEAD